MILVVPVKPFQPPLTEELFLERIIPYIRQRMTTIWNDTLEIGESIDKTSEVTLNRDNMWCNDRSILYQLNRRKEEMEQDGLIVVGFLGYVVCDNSCAIPWTGLDNMLCSIRGHYLKDTEQEINDLVVKRISLAFEHEIFHAKTQTQQECEYEYGNCRQKQVASLEDADIKVGFDYCERCNEAIRSGLQR